MIKSFNLRNFKCFKEQIIEFAPLTLLSGLNGHGKSSVLQALLLLRQSYHQGLLPNIGLALNGEFVQIGTAKDALYENAEYEAIGFKLKWTNNSVAEWIFEYNDEADVLKLASDPISSEIYDHNIFNDDFQYLQAERLGARVTSEKSDFHVRQHRQLGTKGEYCIDFLSTFGRKIKTLQKIAHPKAISTDLIDQTEAWLSEISPGTRLRFNEHSGTDLISLRYAFVTGRGVSSDYYRATNVGFGLTYTLPILIAILSAKPGAILIFENPEAHLHPKGQAQIGELMALAANCGVQIVVETHSDHVLNGIRIAVHSGKLSPESVKVHFFERAVKLHDGSKRNEHTGYAQIVSPQIDLNGRIDYWPEGFFDEWDKSLEALLMPREE